MNDTVSLMLAGLVGGLGTNIVGFVGKRTEYRRDDHARWMTERRDTYAAYIDVMSDCLTECSVAALLEVGSARRRK